MNFKQYPKTLQFRQVLKDLQSLPYKEVTLKGTVKLHGTNAAVGVEGDKFWAQSRSKEITILEDNYGFAHFAYQNKELFKSILSNVKGSKIVVFGEWCGGSIQGGVALDGLPKMFCIFALNVDDRWEPLTKLGDISFVEDKNIFLITKFPTFSLNVDTSRLDLLTNTLANITEEVEKECPVGKYFGVSGVGEGIVWHCEQDPSIRFKVKGQKHSSSKVKKLASIDEEELKTMYDFVDYAVTENRMKQAISEVFLGQGLEVTIQGLGKFLQWVMKDISTEEADTLAAHNFNMKKLNPLIAKKAKEWYISNYCN